MARRTGWIIFGICAALLAASVLVMVGRIARFNRDLSAKYPQYRFGVSTVRSFTALGRPVSITDLKRDDRAYLQVRYADLVQDVPVKAPPVSDLPDLAAGYNEWVKVLEIHEVEWSPGSGGERVRTDKPGTERLVLVSRRTPEGYDPSTWGSVFRDNWTFDIYQFNPDGTLGHETYRWPRSRMAERSLRKQAGMSDDGSGDIKDGDPVEPAARAAAVALLTIPPLEERTWQYQAALHVIPKLSVPKHRFENDAFSPHVLGWTLPVSMLSGLIGAIGLFMAISPRRRPASPAAAGDRAGAG